MSDSKKRLLLVYAGQGTANRGSDVLDTRRLLAALRERGGDVSELDLSEGAHVLLDNIQNGAIPVVVRSDRME